MAFHCSSCESGDIQKLSMVYESGRSTIDATTRGTSTGIGIARGGLGIGTSASKSRTTGVQLTDSAKRAAPPIKRAFGVWLGLIVAAFLLKGILGVFLSLLLLVGAGAMAFLAFKYNRDQFPPLLAAWQDSWMCHRCGSIFRL